MANNNLQLKVVLSALDKLTAPLKKIRSNSSATGKSLNEMNQRLKELTRQQKTVGEFRDLQQGLQRTRIQLQASQSRVAALANQMKQAGKPSRELSRQFEAAKRSVSNLDKSITQQSLKLQGLRGQLNSAGISTRNLSTHEHSLRSQIASTNSALAQQKNRLAQVARAEQHAQKARNLAGGLVMAGVGTTAAGMATNKAVLSTVSAYARAENSATQLKVALMRAGGEVPPEFEKINDLAMKLGDRLPGTTSDFQEMMTMLNRQGIQAQTILGGMGEATAYLGVLLRKTPAEIAEFTAKLQDATRTTERDMLNLTDVIQRAFYLGVDDNNMLQAYTNLAPALDTIRVKGLAAAQAMAPLLVMNDQAGLVGGSAGNALRKIFQRSMDKKRIGKANALMGKAGKLDFTDGKGEFAGIENTFLQLEKLKKLTTQDRNAVIKELFGDNAEVLGALDTMMSKGIEGYREVQRKMEAQATLKERVNVQLGTLSNLWEATTGTFTNALVALGESISPEIKALTEWLGGLAEATGKWAKENPRLASVLMKTAAILGILLTMIGGLLLAAAAIIGPYAMLYVAFAKLGVSGGILIPVLKGIGQGIFFIGRAMLMNPIGLTLTAIAVAALLLYKYWDQITAFIAGLPEKFQKYGSMIAKGLINGILSMGKWVIEKIKSFAASIAETFQASMGIHSPSRLFAEYGSYLTEGLSIGIDRGQSQPLQQMRSLTDQIGRISSGIIIDRKSSEGIRIDKRAPIASSAGGGAASGGNTWNLTIHPPAGSDPNAIADAIARAVAMELDRREREKAVRRSAAYVDY